MKRAAAGFTSCVFAFSASFAQAPPAGDGEIVPATTVILSRAVAFDNDLPGGGERTVRVYKANAGASPSPVASNLYMHKPVWALIPDASGSIVTSAASNGTSEVWRLRTMLSSEAIRQYLKGALGSEPGVTTLPDFNPAVLDVKVYNVLTGDLRCYESLHPTNSIATGTLTNDLIGDNRIILLDVPDSKVLRDAISKKSARCDVTYSYLARQVSMANSVTTFTSNVSSSLEQHGKAERDRGGISFADDLQKLKQRLAAEIQIIITANAPGSVALLPQMTDSIFMQLFKAASFDFTSADTPYKKAIESYLAADAQITQDTQTDQEKQIASSAMGVKMGIDVKFFTFAPNVQNNFSSTHELTTKTDVTTNTTLPGTINVYNLQSNWREALVKSVASVIVTRVSNGDQLTEQLDMALLKDRAESTLGAGAIAPTATGLLPGMAFCYFGVGALGAGWTVLDGGPANKWPTYAWVPLHLRGQPMPDMRDANAVGATSESDVGKTGLNTTFTFPNFELIKPEGGFVLEEKVTTYLVAGESAESYGSVDLPSGIGVADAGPVHGNAMYPLSGSFYVPSRVRGQYPANFYAVHKWRPGAMLPAGQGPVNLADANKPPVQPVKWNDSNRPPYAKCRWVVKN